MAHCLRRSLFAVSCELTREGTGGDDIIVEIIIGDHEKGKDQVRVCVQAHWLLPVFLVFGFHALIS